MNYVAKDVDPNGHPSPTTAGYSVHNKNNSSNSRVTAKLTYSTKTSNNKNSWGTVVHTAMYNVSETTLNGLKSKHCFSFLYLPITLDGLPLTLSIFWLKHPPNVRLCSPAGNSIPSTLWLKLSQNDKLWRPPEHAEGLEAWKPHETWTKMVKMWFTLTYLNRTLASPYQPSFIPQENPLS